MMILSVLLSLISNPAQAQMPEVNYTSPKRIEYLIRTFEAFKQSDNEFVANTLKFLRNQNRYSCSAQAEQLHIQCLISAAAENCGQQKPELQQNCPLVSDVIVNNLVEEKSFINRNELNKILRNVRGSRDQLLTAITGRYARLTADFVKSNENECKSQDSACLAREIDKFCLKRANEKTVAWQGCSGALVWFIGSNMK